MITKSAHWSSWSCGVYAGKYDDIGNKCWPWGSQLCFDVLFIETKYYIHVYCFEGIINQNMSNVNILLNTCSIALDLHLHPVNCIVTSVSCFSFNYISFGLHGP